MSTHAPAALAQELELALTAVRAASEVCSTVQHDLVGAGSMSKGDKSPVTVADFASQAVVAHHLAQAFPDDPLVGEEDASALRSGDEASLADQVIDHAQQAIGPEITGPQVLDLIDRGNHQPDLGNLGRYWTLDPIDGTKGFLRGQQYAVALALLIDGQVVLGVLGCPNLDGPDGEPGLLLSAGIGSGCYARPLFDDAAEPQPCRVTSGGQPGGDAASARFVESVESGHSDQGASAAAVQALGTTAEPVRIDSQCKYAVVAQGKAEVYLRLPTRKGYREKIWDHAAGMICVQEAGGRVTDAYGRPLKFTRGAQLEDNAGIVATSGPLHDAVVDAVRPHLPDPSEV
ncbi:MAG: 3'(2'),5'-bisphosphate nucleotidase [Planctomycetota bacterium]